MWDRGDVEGNVDITPAFHHVMTTLPFAYDIDLVALVRPGTLVCPKDKCMVSAAEGWCSPCVLR